MAGREREQQRGWRLAGRAHTLDVDQSAADGATVLELRGDLDIYTHDQLRRMVAQDSSLFAEPGLVLDLGGVGFVDSSGVGSLVVAHRAAVQRGCTLRLVASDSAVRKLLRITGIDQAIAVHDSRDDALAAGGA